MSKNFLELDSKDQREILNTAAARSEHFSANVLEKDVWICWCLEKLFQINDGKELAFKGGTSLSKVFDVISRFSEDIDLTIDYRSFQIDADPFDSKLSNTKRKKISENLRTQATDYVNNTLKPFLDRELQNTLPRGRKGFVELGTEEASLLVVYPSALGNQNNGYIQDRIKLEFGGRNTTQPNENYKIEPYLKALTSELVFPEADIPVLSAERTFWEKTTLIHAEIEKGNLQATAERKARHWHDLANLAKHEIGSKALKDRKLLSDVIKHKNVFFTIGRVNYDECQQGKLRLIPEQTDLDVLEADFEAMRSSGMFWIDPPAFSEIVKTLRGLEKTINSDA